MIKLDFELKYVEKETEAPLKFRAVGVSCEKSIVQNIVFELSSTVVDFSFLNVLRLE